MLKYIFAFVTISLVRAQPCPNNCNLHGRCIAKTLTCECFRGYSGPDCSLLTCPYGSAWFDISLGVDNAHNLAECSNQGICDVFSGTCVCQNGFEGSACQRKTCPSSCSGVGICMDVTVMIISLVRIVRCESVKQVLQDYFIVFLNII